MAPVTECAPKGEVKHLFFEGAVNLSRGVAGGQAEGRA